ncbi:MAG: DNA/RNA nuclease SfsA [Clostridia bacterium]|nr:DNA/RNA nuclease SfsA [Clostridia bacterium]
MKYNNIKKGVFIKRPNRFIAHILIDDIVEVCHVKNTGRCRELLVPNATVYVQISDNPNRKTKYDLIGVQKGNLMINMDSQIPNSVFGEWARNGGVPNLSYIKGEQMFGKSRLDFYMETDKSKIYAEIKGVTLERDKVALFPDAPTERGIKHLEELCHCINQGFDAWMVFVVQMKGMKYFTPNRETHPEFADALEMAYKKGVKIFALECQVQPDEIYAIGEIPVKL